MCTLASDVITILAICLNHPEMIIYAVSYQAWPEPRTSRFGHGQVPYLSDLTSAWDFSLLPITLCRKGFRLP